MQDDAYIPPAGHLVDALLDLVANQAEDEGCWFVAQTAPEAYLQAQLRDLHNAVEAMNL